MDCSATRSEMNPELLLERFKAGHFLLNKVEVLK